MSDTTTCLLTLCGVLTNLAACLAAISSSVLGVIWPASKASMKAREFRSNQTKTSGSFQQWNDLRRKEGEWWFGTAWRWSAGKCQIHTHQQSPKTLEGYEEIGSRFFQLGMTIIPSLYFSHNGSLRLTQVHLMLVVTVTIYRISICSEWQQRTCRALNDMRSFFAFHHPNRIKLSDIDIRHPTENSNAAITLCSAVCHDHLHP